MLIRASVLYNAADESLSRTDVSTNVYLSYHIITIILILYYTVELMVTAAVFSGVSDLSDLSVSALQID